MMSFYTTQSLSKASLVLVAALCFLSYAYVGEIKKHTRMGIASSVVVKEMLEATDIGTWQWEIDSDKLVWDAAQKKLFGVEEDFIPTYKEFIKCVDDNDVEWVNAAVAAAVRNQSSYYATFKLRTGKYIFAYGRIYFVDGKPIMGGICLPGRKGAYTDKPYVSYNPFTQDYE
ncbi:MAG: hypothetical protein K8R87_01125 [Verrucomicrobia bacterium]|nr:hypothetical protein [Verrucomicrobiota bacterium]